MKAESVQQSQMRNFDVNTLTDFDEAKTLLSNFMERNTAQCHLLAAFRRKLKQQSQIITHLHHEREEKMRLLASQLLLLEANLRLKQQKIDRLLNERDRLIGQQYERIRHLEGELCKLQVQDRHREKSPSHQHNTPGKNAAHHSPNNDNNNSSSSNGSINSSSSSRILVFSSQSGDDSLDDSDSAVIIEDIPDPQSPLLHSADPRNNQVKVSRSISDVVAAARHNLRRITEDGSSPTAVGEENASNSSDSSDELSPFYKRTFLRGSFERIPISQQQLKDHGPMMELLSTPIHSRCLSNHRSVTRPRDVKCKKFHKFYSKSLEELAQNHIIVP